MDKGYSVAIKKLGTIGVTVEIMRSGTRLPHEISIFSDEELKIRESQAEAATEASA
jgi:ribosomal protein S3